jgi:GAF domain-containing protein
MEQADVTESECQTRGDSRCLIRLDWDPTSSGKADLEREVEILREQILVLTKRFESLESVAKELASIRDVNSMLETITRQAGVAVRAPRYLLVAQLPGDPVPRVHHVGFTDDEAEHAAYEVLSSADIPDGQSRLVVDIQSVRRHFGRLAVFYPDNYHFLPQEKSLLMAYAGHAAAALETAAALAESHDRNAALSALFSLGMSLAEQSTRPAVAQRLADALPEIAECDQAYVLLWDEGDALLARVASAARTTVKPAGPEATALRGGDMADRLLELGAPTAVSAASDAVLSSILSLTGLPSGVVARSRRATSSSVCSASTRTGAISTPMPFFRSAWAAWPVWRGPPSMVSPCSRKYDTKLSMTRSPDLPIPGSSKIGSPGPWPSLAETAVVRRCSLSIWTSSRSSMMLTGTRSVMSCSVS